MQYFVYAIGKEEDLISPYSNCYIGVTNFLEKRWKYHSKSRYTVGKYIREYGLTFETNMIVIHMGSSEECFKIENEMRPLPFIGLNEAAGGHGGSTVYSDVRNKLVSEKLKNRDILWADKISKTRIERSVAKGIKNPRAKIWELTSPDGNVIICQGNLQSVCDKNMILLSCLKRYLGSVVPDIDTNGYGGYRAKNEISKQLRLNSVGWKLNLYNGG